MSLGVFVCPALCGCQLIIDGRWVHDPDPNEMIADLPVYYGFPARIEAKGTPSSIRSIKIHQCCLAHAPWQVEPLPPDPYLGTRGYLDIPADPTPAEKLFIRFTSFWGGTMTLVDTCGCVVGVFVDLKKRDIAHFVDHPQHHIACARHKHLKRGERVTTVIDEHIKLMEAKK